MADPLRLETIAQICPLLNAYYIDSHFILALPFYPFTLRNLLDNPAFRPQATSGETQDESDSFGVVSKAVIAQMCSAVAYLEGEGIAHRDVSPSNWLLDVSGRAVLTDFGTAWLAGRAEEAQTAPLDFELGTGGYRAPELLFGSRSYDPLCIDRWALGCCIAQFFTPFAADGAGSDSDETSEDKSSGIPSPWDAIEQKSRGPQSSAGNAPPRPAWMGTNIRARRPKPVKKAALFDGGWSDFALIGSIFKTLGTPSLDTWPVSPASPYRQERLAHAKRRCLALQEAASLPDFGKFSFKAFPARSLSGPSILPNLPQSERDSAADLVQRFLVYPYRQRLTARKAMQHPYLSLDKTVPGRTAPLSPDSTNDQEKGALRKHLAHWI
jgi:cyclin-dependent kinase 8/11